MIFLAAWLTGVLAAASSSSTSRSANDRLDAMRLRLGVGGVPLVRMPVAGGVTIWAWEDGSRIVRLVTPDQVEDTVSVVAEHMEYEGGAAASESVERDDDGDPPEDGISVFAYLDVNNRLKALWIDEHAETWGRGVLQWIHGTGDSGEIASCNARSRIYQFLRDNGMDEDLDDDEPAGAMWWDDILIPSGVIEAMDRVDEGLGHEGLQNLLSELSRESGVAARDYVRAYSDLVESIDVLKGTKKTIEEMACLDLCSQEFLDELVDRGYLEELEDKGIDEDLLKRAMTGGDDEAWNEIKYEITDLQQRILNYLQQDLYDLDIVSDVIDAAKSEAFELDALLLWHDIGDERSSQGSHLSWELHPSNMSAHEYPIISDIRFHIDEGCWGPKAYWVVGGHSQKAPGILRGLQSLGYLETLGELYDKAPEEIVFEWPGPVVDLHMEVMALVGKGIDPVNLDLGDFLVYSFRHGLLHPDAIDYWRNYLVSRGLNPAPLSIDAKVRRRFSDLPELVRGTAEAIESWKRVAPNRLSFKPSPLARDTYDMGILFEVAIGEAVGVPGIPLEDADRLFWGKSNIEYLQRQIMSAPNATFSVFPDSSWREIDIVEALMSAMQLSLGTNIRVSVFLQDGLLDRLRFPDASKVEYRSVRISPWDE